MMNKFISSFLFGISFSCAVYGIRHVYRVYKRVDREIKMKAFKERIDKAISETTPDVDGEYKPNDEDINLFKDPTPPSKDSFKDYSSMYKGATNSSLMKMLEDQDEDESSQIDEDEDIILNKEDKLDMRVDKNSKDALELYISYMVRNVEPQYENILRYLFRIPYKCSDDCSSHDRNLYDALSEKRKEYFGEDSIWYRETNPSFAELILHYVNLAVYDIDGNVNDYLADVLENGFATWDDELKRVDIINPSRSDYEILDQVTHNIYNMNRHQFDGNYGFGLFGLDDEEVDPTVDSYLKEYNIYIGVKLANI